MARFINQKLLSIDVKKLKSIENLNYLTFTPKNVTAILGANCIGKSSLLHALASCYQPEEGERSENHRMSEYLKPNPHALWNTTELSIEYEFENRSTPGKQVERMKIYKPSVRWEPRYDRRPFRSVFYIGIHTTLPILEYINFIKNKSRIGSQKIRYETTELTDDHYRLVKEKASYILNRNYTNIYKHRIQNWNEDLHGLAYDNMTYSQISMGAGEQRIIKIISTVFNAPKHSVILIDEVDLLLHEDAFQRIMEVLISRASKKELQIIFTTHRESVLKKSSDINIRYIYKNGNFTNVLDQVTPDALANLTGNLNKSIILYVEDKLSSRIIKKLSQRLRISRHIKTVEFGAAKNCFAITAGAVITNPEKHIISIIDGDEYSTSDERRSELKKVVTGSSAEAKKQREHVLSRIFQYNLPKGLSPEQYIKESICKLNRKNITEEHVEVYDALNQVQAVLNKHNYVDSITHFYDESEEVIIKDVVDLFSTTHEWNIFTESVSQELAQKAEELMLNQE